MIRSIRILYDNMSIDRMTMNTVTVSPKFQVVIPKAIREQLQLTPGQKIEVIAHDGRIELIPVKPLKSLRGFLEGIDTSVDREDDRC